MSTVTRELECDIKMFDETQSQKGWKNALLINHNLSVDFYPNISSTLYYIEVQ